MDIASGWEQAVKNASNAEATARPDRDAALLELLGDVKSVPLWKFLRVSGSIAVLQLEAGYRAGL